MLTVRFESTFPGIQPLTVDVEGVEDERIARAVALESLVKTRTTIAHRRLDNIEFVGADLSGGSFHGCAFPSAQFHGANLRNACFDECDFSGGAIRVDSDQQADAARPADFDSESDLTGARLMSCNCQGVRFSRACLEGAEFNGVNLRCADLSEVRAEGAKFYRCRTGASDWRDADMRWSLCEGLENVGHLLPQFAGNETERAALVQYQALFRQIGSAGVPNPDAAKALAIAAAERATTTQ